MANRSNELDIFVGDTKKISVTVTDDKRKAIDLTGAKVWMTAKRKEKDLDSKATFQLYSPDNGIVIEPADVKTPGVPASVTFETVVYTAVGTGISWNGLEIVFDGAEDIDTVVANFNIAYPSNQITHNAPSGTVVPSLSTFALAGGVDEVLEAQNGKCLITIQPSDTVGDKTESNFYDIQVKLANGEIYTVVTGNLNIKPAITLATE